MGAVKKASAAGSGAPKRANATKAKPMAMDEHVSVSIRPIENGFIVSHSRSSPKGYEHKETFHAKRPVIDVPAMRKADHVGRQVKTKGK